MKIPNKPTFIHGIAASEALDSSGERINIEGVDISSLVDGNGGCFNFEHESKQASQIVGKILEAKKIFTKKDCTSKAHKYFWNKVKMPFIYTAGILFDDVGHSGAMDVSAMLRFDKKYKNIKQLIHFSIEGSRLGKEGSNITKCIARKVTVTITPCNHSAFAEILENPSAEIKNNDSIDISKEILSKFKKSENMGIEIMKSIPKYTNSLWNKEDSKFNIDKKPKNKANFKTLAPNSGTQSPAGSMKPKREFTSQNAPDKMKVGDRINHRNKKPKTGASLYNDPKTWEKSEKGKKFYTNNIRKTITASCGLGAPSSRTQGAALQKEDLGSGMVKVCKKKKKAMYKSLSEESWKNFEYKDELIDIISSKDSSLNKTEILAFAKTYSYLDQLKNEQTLVDLTKGTVADFNTFKQTGLLEEPKDGVGTNSIKHNQSKVQIPNQTNHTDNLHSAYENKDKIHSLYQRFESFGGKQRTIERMKSLHSKVHDEPYRDGDTSDISWGNKELLEHSGYWNEPFPIPVVTHPKKVGGVIGKGVHEGMGDPFSFIDRKYQTGLQTLKDHKDLPLEINTRSDLISHDEYIKHLNPKKHSINLHFSTDNDQIGKLLEPGAPSFKRRMKAYDKLKNAGFNVNLVHNKIEGMPEEHNSYNKQNMWNNSVELNQIKQTNHTPSSFARNRIEKITGIKVGKIKK